MTKHLVILSLAIILGLTSCKKENNPDEPAQYVTIELNSTATQSRLTNTMLGANKNIRIVGTMNQADFKVLHDNTTVELLDLSKVTIVGEVIVGVDSEGTPIIQNGDATPFGAFGEYEVVTPDSEIISIAANKTIRDVKLPEALTTIGRNTFKDCIGMTHSVVFPAGLINIMNDAFSGCINITGELNFPTSVEIIGENTFARCSSLTGTLTIPKKITVAYPLSFVGCAGFTELILHDDIETINSSTFAGMAGLTKLVLPKNLKQIGFSAFQSCTGLRGDLTMPENLTIIQDRVFVECGFDGVLTFNENLQEIQNYAFDETNFKTIICPWTAEKANIPVLWSKNAHWFPKQFEVTNNTPNYKIYIPAGEMSYYKANFPGKNDTTFFNFKEGKPE